MQTWVAGRAAGWLSKEWGTEVKIGGLDISWFLNVVLQDVSVKDLHGNVLLKSSDIELDVSKIHVKNRFLKLRQIDVKNAEIYLTKYLTDSTLNITFITDYFAVAPDAEPKKPWFLKFESVKLENCTFAYNNQDFIGMGRGMGAPKQAYDPAGIRTQDPNLSSGSSGNTAGFDHKVMDYNHMLISGIDLEAEDIVIAGDSVVFNLKNLNAMESSGFDLHRLSGLVTIKPDKIITRELRILTPGSNISTDLTLSYSDISQFSNFLDSVQINATFSPSSLNLDEIRHFAQSLDGMDMLLHFDGKVRGSISSLKARNFNFSFGSGTAFKGEITLDGLPDIEETFIHLNARKFTTDYYDLAEIRLPGNKRIEFPEELKNVGVIDVKGFFTGFVYDFVASADFYSSIGKLETDLSLKTGQKKSLRYSGQFNLIEWDLGKTFNKSDVLGKASIQSSVDGEIQNANENNLDFDAVVQKFELLRNEFNDISINGTLINKVFNGDLTMKDELANLDFKGMVDFSDTIPRMNFNATLKDAWLSQLNLWERDSTSVISTKMDLDFEGSNLDNLLGYMRFDSTVYSEGGKEYFVKEIELSTQQINHNTKKLTLASDILDASIYGAYTFADFYQSIYGIINLYLPSLRLDNTENQEVASVKTEQMFDYSVQIKNLDPITEIFLPDFELVSDAALFGSYYSNNNTIILNGLADKFIYKGIEFNEWYVRSKNLGGSFELISGVSEAKHVQEDKSKNIGIENFILKAFMQGDSINYNMKWDDEAIENHTIGEIAGYLTFNDPPKIRGRFTDFNVTINDMPWFAQQQNDIIIDSTAILVDNLSIRSNNQRLALSGKISNDPNDLFTLSFSDLNASEADLLINAKNVDLDGIITGDVYLKDLYNTKQIEARVDVKDFAFNKEHMGDATVKSSWDHDLSAINVLVDIIYHGNIGTHLPLSAQGLIYTSRKAKSNFDLDVKVKNYKLASLNPFLRGIASNIKGFASGDLKLLGTFRDPVITGDLDLLRTQLKIDYVNVTYSFADKVHLDSTSIRAKNISVYDSLGNVAAMDFKMLHNSFRDIYLDIDIAARAVNALNTTSRNNSLFYGKAFATGDLKISGSLKEINIDIDARSDPNSYVYIPINLAVDATESTFIKFVGAETSGKSRVPIYTRSESGTNVRINLQVTPSAGIQLFLPENIGNIKGTGSGNIQMGVTRQGEFSIYGDYRMDQGSFLFTLGNIINRTFSIQNGSTISFNGSPYDADINLSAIYKLKAGLKGISTEYAGTSIPVDCIIMLKNDLYNPDISFSIRLPEATNEVNQIIYAAIDTTNQVQMTQQMVSLLVLKTFSVSSAPTLTSTSVGASSIDILTDQLSNMLSQLIEDVDIGVKYRTGDNLTDEEVEVALSTNLFNDRVSIDGNVGMYTTATTQGANNIVGDVVVDVKITPDGRFRIKAFNKSNPFDLTTPSYNAYKQGIGVYYRYEFDKFKELFRRRK